ncbi:malate dehydrogenase [Apiospora arundinis]|uniref:Malate dehydrogenase n=1 Tax=Apiospora arundinis TaxID=335852 RepID=A0ABR2JGM0_9PEZI
MLPQTLLVFASALSAVTAGPVRKRCGGKPIASSSTVPEASTTASATVSASASASASAAPATGPKLPSTGAGTQLPAAEGQLQHIVVGHGIQNYTCKAADSAAASSTGALAVLYDITALAPGGSSPMSETAWSALADEVLHKTELPLNIVGNALTKYAADVLAPFKSAGDADLTMDGLSSPLKAIGHHYFDAAGVPTFDLFATGEKLVAKKLNDTAAPSGADKGIMDTGAVAWLRLGDNGAGGSKGLSQVYRVYTSGGASIACSEANTTISVPYTAQYWFYN